MSRKPCLETYLLETSHPNHTDSFPDIEALGKRSAIETQSLRKVSDSVVNKDTDTFLKITPSILRPANINNSHKVLLLDPNSRRGGNL